MSDKNFRAHRLDRNLKRRHRSDRREAVEAMKKARAAETVEAALVKLRDLWVADEWFRQCVKKALGMLPDEATSDQREFVVIRIGYDWTIRHKGWSGPTPPLISTAPRMARFILDRLK